MFSAKEFEKKYTAWRKALHFIWKLPFTTDCLLLPLISCDQPIEIEMHKIFVKYIYGIVNRISNEVLRICGQLTIIGSRSPTGISFNFLISEYKIKRNIVHEIESDISGLLSKQYFKQPFCIR